MRALESQNASRAVANPSRAPNSLPGQPSHPRDGVHQVHAVILRSGLQLDEPNLLPPRLEDEPILEQIKPYERILVEDETEEDFAREKAEEVPHEVVKGKAKVIPSTASAKAPPLPFPGRAKAKSMEDKFDKFLAMLQKLEVSLPFTEIISQMPLYAKFLKDVLAKKRTIGVEEQVALTVECSAILSKGMPRKLSDPGSFSIPCMVGDLHVKSALCDLGASVSILPLPIAKKIGMEGLLPTRMTLQLADRSLKYPLGVLEDVPVKVGKLYIPVDFVVLDMPEDAQMPIILGRPFLATGGVVIHVQDGKLSFHIGEEMVEFSLTGAVSKPMQESACSIDIIEEGVASVEIEETRVQVETTPMGGKSLKCLK